MHRQATRLDAAANVRNPEDLEAALQASVLAGTAMQHRENDVEPRGPQGRENVGIEFERLRLVAGAS